MFAIAWDSFRTIAKRPSGILLLTILALFTVLVVPLNMKHMGVPFFPRTEYVLTFLTAPLTNPQTPWIIIPLLIIYYAGELVWREREAGLSEIADAAPVPEWILFLGKFLGLGLILVVWTALLAIAGVLAQASMNYNDFEIGLYLKVLFGLQLPEYLLFACLAFALHVLVNQKHLGHLASLVAYGFIAFASGLGIEHHLLVYSSAPNWSYTDMRGFGSSLDSVAVVQALLGSVGAAACGCGETVLGAKQRIRALNRGFNWLVVVSAVRRQESARRRYYS